MNAVKPQGGSGEIPSFSATERKTLFKNLSWSSGAMILRIAIAGTALAAVSHFVTPAEMGFYGVGWAGASFGFTLSQSGAAQGMIALGVLERGHIAAAQFLSLAISLSIGAILMVLAPIASGFYASADYGLAIVIGAAFVPIMSLGAVDIARAQKELLFSRLAIVQTLAVLLAAVVALALALAGYGVLALFALQGLIGFWVFIIFRFHWRTPGFGRFSRRHLVEIWSFGMHLSLGSLTGVIWQNIPQLIIAKVASSDDVGFYVFCQRIVQLIFSQLNGMINTVIYPTFARLRDNPEQVGNAFLGTVKLTFFCLAPPLLTLAAAPHAFLHVYGGEQWITAATVLFYLAITHLILALGANVFPTFMALGRPSVVWRWNLFISIYQGVGVLVVAKGGVVVITQSLAVTAMVMPFAVLWLSRVAHFRMRSYAQGMVTVVLPLVPAIAAGRALEGMISFPPLMELVVVALAANVLYVAIRLAIDPPLRSSFGDLAVRLGKWLRSSAR